MSFGIVRVQKMTMQSVKGIEIHDHREKEGISHTNADIDWEKTKLNYDLCPDQNTSFNQAVKEKIAALQLKKNVRKDAVVMSQALVTSDRLFFSQLTEKEQKQFFKDSYDFLANRYGEKNIISATVHLDEKTPHMHLNFVPITADGRLSAKSLLTPQSLRELQTEFYKKVGQSYGLERGLEGSKQKHLEVIDYKLKNAREGVFKAREWEKTLTDSLKPLQTEYEAKKAYIAECDKLCEISTSIPDYAKLKKIPFGKETITVPREMWEKKHISANEKSCLKQATKTLEKGLEEFKETSTSKKISELEQQVRGLEKENSYSKLKYQQLYNSYSELKDDHEELKDRIQETFHNLTPIAKKDFLQRFNETERPIKHIGLDYGQKLSR